MKVSIDLNTGLLIESQSNGTYEVLLVNAENAGFTNVEIRDVTAVELNTLIAARVAANKTPAEKLREKESILAEAIRLRDIAIPRLDGIAGRASRAGDTATAVACDAASLALIGILNDAAVIASTDAESAQAAITNVWRMTAYALPVSARSVFVDMGL